MTWRPEGGKPSTSDCNAMLRVKLGAWCLSHDALAEYHALKAPRSLRDRACSRRVRRHGRANTSWDVIHAGAVRGLPEV